MKDSYIYNLIAKCHKELEEHNNEYQHVTKSSFMAELEIWLENNYEK